MNHKVFLVVVMFFVNCINKATSEDYEEVDYGRFASSSVDSDSNEVFNSSVRTKPLRREQMEKEVININVNKDGIKYKKPTYEDKKQERKFTYPFSVSIQKKHSHYASGALIDAKWIITSAGEFYNVRESIKIFRARLGSVNCKKGGILVALKGVEIHPLYMYREPLYDVSLLRIAQPITFNDHIKPIAISKAVGEIISAKFLTTYWPRLIINGKVLPASAKERVKHESMRVSTQKLVPWKKCAKLITNQTLDHSTICLEPIVTHHSLCSPDVGAPVLAEDTLWGVTSGWTSEACSSHPTPTLFSRLADQNTRFWLDSMLLET